MESERTERALKSGNEIEQERNQIKEINKWKKNLAVFFQSAGKCVDEKMGMIWNGKEQRKRLYRTPKVQNEFQLFHAYMCTIYGCCCLVHRFGPPASHKQCKSIISINK